MHWKGIIKHPHAHAHAHHSRDLSRDHVRDHDPHHSVELGPPGGLGEAVEWRAQARPWPIPLSVDAERRPYQQRQVPLLLGLHGDPMEFSEVKAGEICQMR